MPDYSDLDADEAAVCRALDRLVKLWPDTRDREHPLVLASMGGSLVVFKGDYMARNDNPMGANRDMVIWSSSAIPNTGGDW